MSVDQSITPIEYRDIPGFPGYRAGSDGSVWVMHNTRRVPCEPRRIFGNVTPKGYVRMTIHPAANRMVPKMAHELVLLAFVGPRPSGMEACHWDGDKRNNRLDNLRWDTPKGNQADRRRLNEFPDFRGDANPNAKLSEVQVVEIKSLIAAGVKNHRIAKRFGVSNLVISKIKTGRTWGHIQ